MPKTPLLPGMAGAGVVPWCGPAPAAGGASPPPPASGPGFLPGFEDPELIAVERRFSDEYLALLKSPRWLYEVRPRIIERAKGFCERCPRRTDVFEVHHLNYDRLGRELDSDLQAVCPPCHPEADAERRAAFRRMAEMKLAAAREEESFLRFCRIKYGEGFPPDWAREEYQEALESDWGNPYE